MTDIKETIQGLYALKTYLASKAIEEAIEEHGPARESLIGMQKVVDSAVNLLKEQEAVEPIPPTDESDLWKCGNCKHQLFRCTHQRYCEMCGREVKWE